MRKAVMYCLWALTVSMFLFGCGGDDSAQGSGSTGTVSIGITDAKPLLDVDATQVLITVGKVRVHKAGGGWRTLPLAQDPYTLDLLQFTDGATSELVPPVELDSGKYTQVRLGIIEGSLVTTAGVEPLEIPSGSLKTDKNFVFQVAGGEAVDLMVDFDLSQSIKPKHDGYQLKPVLHLNETQRAAQIRGSIAPSTFVDSEAAVTVTHEGEEYTRLLVSKTGPVDPTEFRIYWLVPNKAYTVEVEVDGTVVLEETVAAADLEAGEVFALNLGSPI